MLAWPVGPSCVLHGQAVAPGEAGQNVTTWVSKVSCLPRGCWRDILTKARSVSVTAGKASCVQKERMTVICIYLIQKVSFQREKQGARGNSSQ